jgi:excisionase family DNA binding protein
MNPAVNTLYAQYLDHTGGDKAAAASLALADTLLGCRTPTPQPPERPMSVPEVARLLRVMPAKVLRWIHGGELSATNVATRNAGRPRYRISQADLAVFRQHRASLTTQSAVQRRATRRHASPFPATRHSQT